jgi:hypothetical protein
LVPHHETTSAKLARLTVLFEYEIDESGKSEGHVHEWK